MAKLSLTTARLFFRTIGLIAPSKALTTLQKQVFTPDQPSARSTQETILDQAVPTTITVPGLGNNEPWQLQTYRWEARKLNDTGQTVLIVHGWGRNAADFYKIIPELQQAGYSVLAFDAPAHGQSSGEQTNVAEFAHALTSFLRQIETPYALIGHSVGAAAIILALTDQPTLVKKVVLAAPTVVTKHFIDKQLTELAVPNGLRRLFYQRIAEQLGAPLNQFDLRQRTGGLTKQKVLVLFDTSDRTVDEKDIMTYLEKEPDFKQRATVGYGHRKMMRSTSVTNLIVQFLKNE